MNYFTVGTAARDLMKSDLADVQMKGLEAFAEFILLANAQNCHIFNGPNSVWKVRIKRIADTSSDPKVCTYAKHLLTQYFQQGGDKE